MIHVSAACYAKLLRCADGERIGLIPRLRWTLQDQTMDVTARLLNAQELTLMQRIGAYLTSGQMDRVTFSIENADRYFSPSGDGSYVANLGASRVFSSVMDYDVGVVLDDGSVEYVDVFRGLAKRVSYVPGRVDVEVYDMLSAMRSIELPAHYEVGVGPVDLDPALLVKQIVTDNTPLDASYFGSSFDAASDLYRSMDWTMFGEIERGARLGDAIDLLASTGVASLWTDAAGLIQLEHEFPSRAGSLGFPREHFPTTIDEHVANDFTLGQGQDVFASEVVVTYQGLSVGYRDSDIEAIVGRVTRTVPCPYIRFARSARLAAYILYLQGHDFCRIHGFSVGPWGLLLELNDRVRIENPVTGEVEEARITAKEWQLGATRFEAVTQGHKETILDGTYGTWASTAWGGLML